MAGPSHSTLPARCGPRAMARTASCCRRVGGGDGGAIDYTQAGNVVTAGDGSIGIIAQSLGGGGGFAADAFGNAGGTGNAGSIGFDLNGSIFTAGDGSHGALLQSDWRRRRRRDRLRADRRRHDRWRRRDRDHRAKPWRRRRLRRWRVRQCRRHRQCGIDRGRSHWLDLHRPATARTAHCCKASAAATAATSITPKSATSSRWATIRSASLRPEHRRRREPR